MGGHGQQDIEVDRPLVPPVNQWGHGDQAEAYWDRVGQVDEVRGEQEAAGSVTPTAGECRCTPGLEAVKQLWDWQGPDVDRVGGQLRVRGCGTC